MTRLVVLALPLLLVTANLTGCGLIWGSSHLEDALETMPGSVDRVTFFDRARATQLDLSLRPMLEDAPFSALDVEWEVVGQDGEEVGRVWKMDDDLDLDDAADELVDLGYTEEDSDGDSRTLTIDLERIEEDRHYLAPMRTLAVIPDEHLVVTGPLTATVIEVVADDEDSAIDTDAFEELRDTTDDVEFADLARGDRACSGAQQSRRLADLGRPEETAFFVYGDKGDARSVLRFGSDEDAEDDAEAREQFLEEEASPVSGVPYSELGDWEIEVDGDQELIEIDYDDPRAISGAISRGDYLSICGPQSSS